MINKKEFKKFIKEAKVNTYAKSDERGAQILKDGGKKFEYKKDNFYYRDIYYGFNPFVGEEVVYQDKNPVWGMNYFGFILADDLTEKEISSFLRKSLIQEYDGIIPVRGPREFSENNWTYKLSVNGDLSRFTGQEKILRDGRVVYQLFLHGGFIQ